MDEHTPIPKAVAEYYFSVENMVTMPTTTLSVSFFLYGIYFTLFLLSVYILSNRRKRAGPSSFLDSDNTARHMSLTVLVFILTTTADAAYLTGIIRGSYIFFHDIGRNNASFETLLNHLDGKRTGLALSIIDMVCLILLNVVFDIILIHRCYLIWDRNKLVTYPLVIISSMVNLSGLVAIPILGVGSVKAWPNASCLTTNAASPLLMVFFIASVILNVLITALTAGRIGWISREARKLIGEDIHLRYRTIVALIVESGCIYPITQILNLSLLYGFAPPKVLPFYGMPMVITASSIAPTLIIVRVAVGQSVEPVDVMMHSLKFEPTEGVDVEACSRSSRSESTRIEGKELTREGARTSIRFSVDSRD